MSHAELMVAPANTSQKHFRNQAYYICIYHTSLAQSCQSPSYY